MNKKTLLLLAVFILVTAVLTITPAAQAASSDYLYFLKIDDIAGESTNSAHKGEIDVVSFGWGLGQDNSGKLRFNDFSFTARLNKASPKISEAVFAGKHYKKAILSVRKVSASNDLYKTVFLDVIFNKYLIKGDENGMPLDEISFNYAKTETAYAVLKTDGSILETIKAVLDKAKAKY